MGRDIPRRVGTVASLLCLPMSTARRVLSFTPRHDRVTAHELARGMVAALADRLTAWQGRKSAGNQTRITRQPVEFTDQFGRICGSEWGTDRPLGKDRPALVPLDLLGRHTGRSRLPNLPQEPT